MARARRTRRSPRRLTLAVALVAALAVHAIGLWAGRELAVMDAADPSWRALASWAQGPGMTGAASSGATGAGSEARPVELRNLDDDPPSKRADDLVAKLSRLDEKSPEEQKREEEKKLAEDKDEEQRAGQVVDIAPPIIEERPDKARFAAEYNSRVARETRGPTGRDRAGSRVEVKGGATSRLGELQPRKESAPAGLPGQLALRRVGAPASSGPVRPRVRPGEMGQDGTVAAAGPDGSSRRAGAAGTPGARTASRPRLGGSGGDAPLDRDGQEGRTEGGAGGRGGPRLAPSEEMLNRAIARGSGSSDYLEGLDDGESTALNAKRFKYASFFNRVHHAVAHEWFAPALFVRNDPTGNIYGARDRATIVRVHLHPDGNVKEVTLLDSSGVSFLDDEALDAIRRAAPFVNPPPQLVQPDGLIHFNFGFFLDNPDHPRVKVFRYR